MFWFNNTYLQLPEAFYSLQLPTVVSNPYAILINKNLFEELNIIIPNRPDLSNILSGNTIPATWSPFSQAYAGHQFGHFNLLGDGRAIVLGEHLADEKKRVDIQLKGAGVTPYSRRGDGRATLKSMLREYLISEAMHHLQISTSRSLAVIATGEKVYRESIEQGAVLTRVMKSHLRVGTFEYARYYCGVDNLRILADYTINRLYSHINELSENKYLDFFKQVMTSQIELVVHWMRVGFIHGVMNTDNTSISAETFDYGPCAFMNTYNPQTVYSSIDSNGRYAFGNQPYILKWNLLKLAEALLPLMHENESVAITIAQEAINTYDALWDEKYNKMMCAKLGIDITDSEGVTLFHELLEILSIHQLDYTNTFRLLTHESASAEPFKGYNTNNWLERWKKLTHVNGKLNPVSYRLMQHNNPTIIPRNHLVEEALDEATNGDLAKFMKLTEALKTPYTSDPELNDFTQVPSPDFDSSYQTFCGT
jgi:serine/tyrosine/threonine adenylyltransferase